MHTFHVISRELGSNVCFNLIHNDSIPETSVQYACRAAFALLTSPLKSGVAQKVVGIWGHPLFCSIQRPPLEASPKKWIASIAPCRRPNPTTPNLERRAGFSRRPAPLDRCPWTVRRRFPSPPEGTWRGGAFCDRPPSAKSRLHNKRRCLFVRCTARVPL